MKILPILIIAFSVIALPARSVAERDLFGRVIEDRIYTDGPVEIETSDTLVVVGGDTLGVVVQDTVIARDDATPYQLRVARGVESGSGLRIQGYYADVDDAVETCWPVGGAYVFPAAAQQMEIVSTSTSDDGLPAGTGALTVEIHYLTAAWAEKTDVVTLDGTTVVTTNASDIYRINDFHVMTVGTSGSAVGDIDVRNVADTPIYARISAGFNSHQSAVYTVPISKTLYINAFAMSSGSAAGTHYVVGRMRATVNNGSWNQGVFYQFDGLLTQNGFGVNPFYIPIIFPAKTDVVVTVVSDNAASNAAAFTTIEGILK